MRKTRELLGLGISLWMIVLAGCEGKTVDYNIDGIGETEDAAETAAGNAGSTGMEQFAAWNGTRWEDQWTITRENANTRNLSIDADIRIPEAGEMYVVSVSEPDVGAEYKENIARNCFDSGYIYYFDFIHLPKKNLEAQIEAYEDSLEDKQYNQVEREWFEEGIETCRKALETASDQYTVAENFETDAFMGNRDGISYTLKFLTMQGGTGVRMQQIWMCPLDSYAVCPEEMKHEEDLQYMPYDGPDIARRENLCKLSEEEAREKARQTIVKLGLEYPVFAYSMPLVWGSAQAFGKHYDWGTKEEDDARRVDGYAFYFDAGIRDVSFTRFGTEEQYIYSYLYSQNQMEPGKNSYSMNARVGVYVTDRGVIWMEAKNPIVTDEISEPVKLLPLETVKNIMEDAVTRNYDDFGFRNMGDYSTFDGMELIYLRLRDREHEGHYSYVPVWRLSDAHWDETGGADSILNEVLVNAVDGSIIHFMDEILADE